MLGTYVNIELANPLRTYVRGSVYILRDVVRTYIFFFFSSFIDTLFLLCDSKSCTYDVIYIYDEVVITVLSPIFTYVVFFFFSLYAHASYNCMQSFISVSH